MTERVIRQERQQNPKGRAEALLITDSFELLTGKSNPSLARDIARNLEKLVDEPITIFPDGEIHAKISANARNKEIFIIQPTVRNLDGRSVNDAVMEMYLMIRAAKRASSGEITAVMPYYGYGRGDRKDEPRITIPAADIAELIESAGASRILTLDVHSEQVAGAFKGPWDNIFASAEIIPVIKKQNIPDLMVVSPDVGGTKRAEKFSMLLGGEGEGDIAIIHKRRSKANDNMAKALAVVGEVANKNVLLVDDIIDTAGTMVEASKLLMDKGAKSIRIAATHGLYTPPAWERLLDSPVEQIFITDTIEIKDEIRNHPKVSVVTVAPILAKAIDRIYTGESVSALIPKVEYKK